MANYYEWMKARYVGAPAMDGDGDVTAPKNAEFEEKHPRSKTSGKGKGQFTETIKGAEKKELAILNGILKGNGNGQGNGNTGNHDGRRQQANADFDAVCRASDGVSEERSREYRSGHKFLSSEEYDRIAEALGGWLDAGDGRSGSRVGWTVRNPKTGRNEDIIRTDGKTFRKLFACCRKYLESGDQVDLHDEEYYEKGFGIVSKNGMAGFFITNDGDAVSGYSLSARDEIDGKMEKVRGGGFFKTIAPLMRKYAKTTDCFNTRNQNLPKFYKSVFGFKEASVLPFDRSIMEQFNGKEYTDWFVSVYGESPVSFMVMTDDPVETKTFTDYDQAHDYQLKVAEETSRPIS